MIHQIDSKNEGLLLLAGFTAQILKVFNGWTLKQIVSKTKTFFKILKYDFLVESTKIKNASFP